MSGTNAVIWGERRDIADETFEVVEKFWLAAVNGSSIIDAASFVTDFTGAEGGSRTRTSLRTTDFKSVASAIPPPRHARKNTMPLADPTNLP